MKKIKETENQYIKISKFIKVPMPIALALGLLLLGTSFYSGYAWNKLRNTDTSTTKASANTITFDVQKSQKPELKFFVMSFCPYGNQMEDVLRPIFDLLKDTADITPHYIFDKIENLDSYCKNRSGDATQCAAYVENKYFTTVADCQKAIAKSLSDCNNESAYIKSDKGVMYASLHGRQEANQDVREICAWNLATDKTMWWDFVGNVNKNCTDKNADTCWENEAKSAGYDTAKITECFNKEGVDLIEKEIALTTKFNVSGSPTVLVNDVTFPPETAYTQDGKGSLKIGGKVATQDRYRTPNVIKEALCASFQKSPSECKSEIPDLTGESVPAGGC